jgi:hypothetical protein
MRKSKTVHRKKRGRPATGRDPAITARLPSAVISDVSRWAAENSLSRSEAIRRLVEIGLSVNTSAKPTRKETARKASQLAAREIDPLGDRSMPPEEQAQRKRALIRGPKEFREIREDQPKLKS